MISPFMQPKRRGIVAPFAGRWQEARLLLRLDADLEGGRWLAQIYDQAARRPVRRLDLDQALRSVSKTFAL